MHGQQNVKIQDRVSTHRRASIIIMLSPLTVCNNMTKPQSIK